MHYILPILIQLSRSSLFLFRNNIDQLEGKVLFFTKQRKIFTSFEEYSKDKNGNESYYSVLPPEPQDCCMSGCANCVWIKYAEDMAKLMGDGGEAARVKIMENVKDPNLRAFLIVELNYLLKKKDEK